MRRGRHRPGETAMRMKIVIVLTAVVLVFAARTSAHHAFAAEFDASKPIKLRGTVVKMEWINPHTWIHLDVKTPKGTVERWMIEAVRPMRSTGVGSRRIRCRTASRSWWRGFALRMDR